MIWFGCLLSYLPTPSARAGYDTRSIVKRSLTGLNSELSFSNAKELGQTYYLPVGLDSYLSQGLCEMQSVSSMI